MNRLARETSPYLLQHAENPVDWYPWSEEALQRARREDKPILLSIGYSACHWCHVMAHESFEDPATAALMNRLYVNIKVDREERPDLDRIYQLAHQMMARRPGGWPLTMFLRPEDQTPFFGGTYFPPRPYHGMPAFAEVLERVAAFHAEQPSEAGAICARLREALASLDAPAAASLPELGEAPLRAFRAVINEQADREFGGFGEAPKFPHPTTLDRLLRHWRESARGAEPDKDALYIVALTLKRMAEGGIFDHLGGGFCRYSVDRYWSIPHFEKMLYDNGALLALYAQLFQISGDESYRATAGATAAWALREMRAPEGGFYAALDADSEGAEGRYYLWTPEQVQGLLDEEEAAVMIRRFGLDHAENFHDPHSGARAWHLRVHETTEAIAAQTGLPVSTIRGRLDAARAKLFQAREGRVRPGLDDKILTSWNALMIRGLAIAAAPLGQPELVTAAAAATDFLRTRLVADGRLLASYRNGRARFNAYLDDHALLLDAVLELLQHRWDPEQLAFARWLADRLLEGFEDPAQGGFWFTAHDHEPLLHRIKPLADEAMPSGNGVAALALGRLGHLLGELRYLEAAERTLRFAWPMLSEHPQAHPSLLNALAEYLTPPPIVIIRGSGAAADEWAAAARAAWNPARLVFVIPEDAAELPGALRARRATGQLTAYVCTGQHCTAPATSLPALLQNLDTGD